MMSLFETLRDQVDLMEVAERHLDLTRSGSTGKCRCPYPDHQDRSPSFCVYTDGHFYCYGCRRHGDVVDLYATIKGFESVVEAALDLYREYDLGSPDVDPRDRKALTEAQRRRDVEAEHAVAAREAHERLARYPEVVEYWDGRGFGEELRDRFMLGVSEDGSAAVIPFWNRGRVQALILRRLRGEPKYLLPKVEEFAGRRRPLFIPGSARTEVLLVEGYLDALAATALGFDAVAIGGTGMSPHQKDELWALPCPVYYVIPDDDEEGAKAAHRWVRDLYPKALLCPPISTMFEKERKD